MRYSARRTLWHSDERAGGISPWPRPARRRDPSSDSTGLRRGRGISAAGAEWHDDGI